MKAATENRLVTAQPFNHECARLRNDPHRPHKRHDDEDDHRENNNQRDVSDKFTRIHRIFPFLVED